jgi:mRNA-degrading endonuclease RelE of RelBE toxin-antitoxin system
MSIRIELSNPCVEPREHCRNCNSHFMSLRPLIKGVIVSKHFMRDLKDTEKMNSIVNDVLDCSHLEFNELHKFEENIDGTLIFRAKRENMHIVYCVDKKIRLIFLRAISNFTEYEKFLDNRKKLKRIVREVNQIQSP